MEFLIENNISFAIRLIPTCTDQNSFAHSRPPMEAMRSGWAISLFQASQQ
jgi:hypothetical protein